MRFFRAILQSLRNLMPVHRNATVRYMFPLMLGITALIGANALTSTDSSYIRLESSQTSIMAGERFSLDVYAYAHVPVNAVDITLRFQSGAVEVVEVDRGQSVLTIWTEDPIIESDRVILRGGTFRRGFLGEHLVATIDLVAKQTGQNQFSASDVILLAGDGQGTKLAIGETNESKVNLYVYDENEDPANIGVNVQVSVVTDIDGDGAVSLKDISSFMGAWSSQSAVYDFNGDGRMSFRDFSIILSDFFFK